MKHHMKSGFLKSNKHNVRKKKKSCHWGKNEKFKSDEMRWHTRAKVWNGKKCDSRLQFAATQFFFYFADDEQCHQRIPNIIGIFQTEYVNGHKKWMVSTILQ